MHWPGIVKPGSQSDYAGLIFDVFPTFLTAAGGHIPTDTDAVDLTAILRGTPAPPTPRDLYFVRREGGTKYGGKSYEAQASDYQHEAQASVTTSTKRKRVTTSTKRKRV